MKQLTKSLLLLVVVALLPLITKSGFGESSVISTSVSLSYLNVQLSYPSEILPGENFTVNFQATAKDYVRVRSLTLDVYFASGKSLRLLTSTNIASNYRMNRGDRVSKDVQVTIPLDAPRTSVIALVSEDVRLVYYYYDYYYPYYYWNYSYWYYAVFPSYTYTDITDDAIAPLSYIKATTPEYVSLQAEYQMLEEKLNGAQAQNQKLQRDLESERNTVQQKDAIISDLTQRLEAAENTVRLLEIASAALLIIIAAMGALAWRTIKKLSRSKPESPTKEET